MKGPSISRFIRQYLQLEHHLDYPPPTLLQEEETQVILYNALFAEDALPHPPPERYQFKVLQHLVSSIEQSIDDWDKYGVSEDLMTSLSRLLVCKLPPDAIMAEQKSYVTYTPSLLDSPSPGLDPRITLLEHRNVLSAFGVTGHRTWDAALHMGQYLSSHPHLIRGRRVFELGAGPGYISILCAKYLGATHVIASDGADEVVATLSENFYLNGLHNSPDVKAVDYIWGHALMGTEEKEWNGGQPVDVILGADITYDPSIIPPLISAIQEFHDLFPHAVILIAAAERNQDTFGKFVNTCQQNHFSVREIDYPLQPAPVQTGPFYSDKVPIRICEISSS
ncbi:putative methyltransferase-domain-containing protein [Xylariaceae sp. FL0255]|nr:putative methyltransferase-domain-containing protein [Xylariaceae sp. FL0255]